MRAELDAVICSGPRHGKQFTYALLEERVPRAAIVTREEALEALTRRYFVSHGPATVRDYVWWSGLTTRDARTGLALAREALVQETVGDQVYWRSESAAAMPRRRLFAHLLPNYDEYLIAYKDRGAVVGRPPGSRRAGQELVHQLVIDGRLAGSWKRMLGTSEGRVEVRPYGRLTADLAAALDRAVDRYRRFVGAGVSLVLNPPDQPTRLIDPQ
jgi:hypothetical protein